MTPETIAVLEQLVAFAIQAAPAIADDFVKVVKAFRASHPALQDPPPADSEAALDAAIDAEIAKLEP